MLHSWVRDITLTASPSKLWATLQWASIQVDRGEIEILQVIWATLKAGMTERWNSGTAEWRNHGTAESDPKP